MILKSISILNYKNIEQVDLNLSNKLNCFVGQNGEGKTNLLDAICYMAFCKSAFSINNSQTIRHGEDFMTIQGIFETQNGDEEKIHCALRNGGKKIIRRNDKVYSKLADHIGLIPLVIISPQDTSLITGGSEGRRHFMDMVISQYDALYSHEVIRYRNALQQRNALLRVPDSYPDEDMLSIYESIMADSGKIVYNCRKNFIEKFIPIFISTYQQLGESREKISLRYKSCCNDDLDLATILLNGRKKDFVLGHTLHGLHRDDLEMELNGYDIKYEGSQGQVKTFLTSLKFAQFYFMKQQYKDKTPILLLDDIFDKLDAFRVNRILQMVSSDEFSQIFITDTKRQFLEGIISRINSDYKFFGVEKGNITEL